MGRSSPCPLRGIRFGIRNSARASPREWLGRCAESASGLKILRVRVQRQPKGVSPRLAPWLTAVPRVRAPRAERAGVDLTQVPRSGAKSRRPRPVPNRADLLAPAAEARYRSAEERGAHRGPARRYGLAEFKLLEPRFAPRRRDERRPHNSAALKSPEAKEEERSARESRTDAPRPYRLHVFAGPGLVWRRPRAAREFRQAVLPSPRLRQKSAAVA